MKLQLPLSCLFLYFVLSSCSFDGLFLHPNKIPVGVKSAKLIEPSTKQRVIMHIEENYQPVFRNERNEPIDLNYNIESIVFETAVKNKLNAWIISPDSGYIGSTILFLHGNAGNIINHYPATIPFVERGFKVLLLDYSGFGFSDGEATRDNVLLDANAALDYLISRKDLGTRKILIYGQSLGGHLSAIVAAKNQNKIDGLIIEGAFSSHKNIAANMVPVLGRILVAEKYSALLSIKEFKKPVLIIHSTEDKIIPFKMGKKLYDKANAPKQFYQIEKCHICGPFYYADSIVAKIGDMAY